MRIRISKKIFGFIANIPFRKKKSKVPAPQFTNHENWGKYLSETFNKPGMRILEIGSRDVTNSVKRKLFDKAEYVGMDIMAGPNVDIVGNAHALTKLLPNQKFDLIFSSAVFEHLYMPWIVTEEISKLLNVGGYAFTETHFSFASHERPWNFFQFSDMGLAVLFNKHLGFEVIEKGMDTAMSGYFSSKAAKHLRYRPIGELYCHSSILVKKVAEPKEINWRTIPEEDLVDGTFYPSQKA